uniref:Uncharacterized protein MANES_04G038500 n=1 Tax=Rhizophora mucronata TaxID=61149 RepID=A0A2P2M5G6_RHIMU
MRQSLQSKSVREQISKRLPSGKEGFINTERLGLLHVKNTKGLHPSKTIFDTKARAV